jgi:hypothetical protein
MAFGTHPFQKYWRRAQKTYYKKRMAGGKKTPVYILLFIPFGRYAQMK